MVTISNEEYADLIRAQHTLEQIIAMSDKWIFSYYRDTFNAVVGIDENLPTETEREEEFKKLINETGAVKMDDKQIEEVWGKPHEAV